MLLLPTEPDCTRKRVSLAQEFLYLMGNQRRWQPQRFRVRKERAMRGLTHHANHMGPVY